MWAPEKDPPTDGRDQFFEPLHPSILRNIESLAYGLSWNSHAPGRHMSEWLKVMTWAGLRGRLNNP